jgi:hypothetical protein
MSATPTPAAPSAPSRTGRHRYRSRRGTHHNAPQGGAQSSTSIEHSVASDTSLPLRQAAVTPATQQETSTMSAGSGAGGANRRGRGGRGGRPGRRGASSTQIISGGGRMFGRQLTRAEGSSPGSLQADAPEFRPGQPVQPRP